MITFKSNDDLQKLPSPNPVVEELVERLINIYGDTYDPEGSGYVVLVEPEDADRVLDEILDYRLIDIPWEGIIRRDDQFIAIFLANNEFGICFVIPDADWVQGELRDVIEYNLDP